MNGKDLIGGFFALLISGYYLFCAFAVAQQGNATGATMSVVVALSSIWVFYDARSMGARKGLVSGLGNLGPWGWYFGTALLWIVGFPLYLVTRPKLKRALAESRHGDAAADSPIVEG